MRTSNKVVNTSLIKNAGALNHKITIYRVIPGKDAQGFPANTEEVVLTPWASVKTTRGMTIIINNSDFEKAYTNFTIRYPSVEITREMLIRFNGKVYTIEYLNNVDERNVILEIQAKEVTH